MSNHSNPTGRNTDRKRSGFKEDRILTRQNTGGSQAGLMDFLGVQLPDAKRGDIKKWLKYGHVMVQGEVTTAFDAPVPEGGWVELNFTRPFPIFSHPRLKILYEDDDVIVVNKGYGLLSVGTDRPGKVDTAYSLLRDYVKRKHPSNKIFIVHRLDRDTSGLMMFAKTVEAKETMQHNWNNLVLDRTYVAVLEGELDQDEGVVKSYLAENSRHQVYSTPGPGEGKLAVTRYKVLRRGHGRSLVEFSLDTGRKNQIRVHAHDLGHPIIGDRRYGAQTSPINRLALHAKTLRFAHPVTRKDMKFETPVPSKFQAVV